MLLFWKKNSKGKKVKILIWSKEKNILLLLFLKAFLKDKIKHALIRKFNPTSNEKKYHHPIFVQYKKQFIYLYAFYCMK